MRERGYRAREGWIAAAILVMALAAPRISAQGRDARASSAAASAPATASPADRIGLSLRLGFSNFQPVKPGFWYPLWADLNATDLDLKGELTLRHGDTPLRVRIPVDAPKGSRKRYLSWYRIAENSTGAPELYGDARFDGVAMSGLKTLFRQPADGERHILVLTDEPGTFTWLSRRIDAGRSGLPSAMDDRVVIYSTPDFLPAEPVAFESLDSVIISGALVREIRSDQWQALGDWVRAGGRILLVGGHYQRFIEASALNAPFGIELAPPVEIEVPTVEGPVAVLAALPGNLTPDDRIRVRSGGDPLLVSRPVGRGFFHYSAVALEEKWLDHIGQTANPDYLWGDMLEIPRGRTDMTDVARDHSSAIGFLLQQPFVISIAGIKWLSAYLGLYLLLVVPVNWFVCRRAGRREWAWPVAVMLAVMFSLYGYISSARGGNASLIISQMTVMTRPAADAKARTFTSSVLFTPRRFNSGFKTAASAWPAYQAANEYNPYYYAYSDMDDLYAGEPFDADFSDGAALRDFFIHPWSARNMTTETWEDVEGGILPVGGLMLDPDTGFVSSGTILNTTKLDFDLWWIEQGTGAWEGDGPLAAGGERGFSAEDYQDQSAIAAAFSSAVQINRDLVRAMAVTEEEAKQEGYHSYEEAGLKQMLGHSRGRAGAGFRFIGVARGAVSPLLRDVPDARRAETIIYEQDLSGFDLSAPDPGARDFTLNYFDEDSRRRATVYWGEPVSEHNRLTFQGETMFRAHPSVRFETGPADHIELHLSIRAEPYAQRESARTGQGNEVWFEPVAAPLNIYNFRTYKFEALEDWDGSVLSLAPASDYLDPITSLLAFSINAEYAVVRYARVEVKNGERIAGEPLVTVEDLNRREFYHYGNNYLSVRLESVRVTDEPGRERGIHPVREDDEP